MHQIRTLLEGVLEARGKVLVKLNVPADRLDAVIDLLPSMKSPTVNELYGGAGYAVETVVPKATINVLIPALQRRRRHRHHRAADLQDRPLTPMASRATGRRRSTTPPGSRHGRGPTTAPSTSSTARPSPTAPAPSRSARRVTFEVVPGRRGQWEAADLEPGVNPTLRSRRAQAAAWPRSCAGRRPSAAGRGRPRSGLAFSPRRSPTRVDHGRHGVDGQLRPRRSSGAPGTGGSPPARRSRRCGW